MSDTYPVGNCMLMLMASSLPLLIYDADFNKDPRRARRELFGRGYGFESYK